MMLVTIKINIPTTDYINGGQLLILASKNIKISKLYGLIEIPPKSE